MEWTGDGYAGTVDGQIKATRGCHCGIDNRAYRIGIPDVAGRSGHACTITGETCGNEIESRTVDVGQKQLPTFPSKNLGASESKAARRAGNEGALLGEALGEIARGTGHAARLLHPTRESPSPSQ
jgi:hypothetical protein